MIRPGRINILKDSGIVMAPLEDVITKQVLPSQQALLWSKRWLIKLIKQWPEKTNNAVPASAAFYLCLCNPLMIRCAKTGRCAANYHFLQGLRVCHRSSAKRGKKKTLLAGSKADIKVVDLEVVSWGFGVFCECKWDRGWAFKDAVSPSFTRRWLREMTAWAKQHR